MKHRISIWACLAALLILPLWPPSATGETNRSGLIISHRFLGFHAGGGRVVSAGYMADVSLGGMGGSGQSHQAHITLQHGRASQLNDPPVTRADAIVRAADEPASSLLIAQLLANDTDLERDPLKLVAIAETSEQGGVVIWEGEWIQYIPPPHLVGIDVFTYTIADSHGDRAEGRVYVLPQTGASSWEPVLHIDLALPGTLRLLAQIPVSPKIVLVASDDLVTWHPILTNLPVAEVAEYVPAGELMPSSQDYRAISTILARQPFAMAPIEISPDRTVRLLTRSAPQLQTVIEASRDLIQWRPVMTNLSLVHAISFSDLPQTNTTLRFYKVYAHPF
jgi:hypothetical protein